MDSKDHSAEWLHVASTVIRSLPSRIKFYHDHSIPVIKAVCGCGCGCVWVCVGVCVVGVCVGGVCVGCVCVCLCVSVCLCVVGVLWRGEEDNTFSQSLNSKSVLCL